MNDFPINTESDDAIVESTLEAVVKLFEASGILKKTDVQALKDALGGAKESAKQKVKDKKEGK